MFLQTFTVLLMMVAVDSRLPDAARVQDSKTVRALIEDKVDVNARSSDGVHSAAVVGALERCDDCGVVAACGSRCECGERFRYVADIGSMP